MSAKNQVSSVLEKYNINFYGFIPFSACGIANRRLYDRCVSEGAKTVVIFAVPYKTNNTPVDDYQMSEYARVYDYHKKFDNIFQKLIPDLQQLFPENVFLAFTDHSPVNEKLAAAGAGLGVIGKNTLLITEKYGSYVFLGEIITDLEIESTEGEILSCADCGICKKVCPAGAIGEKSFDVSKCLSNISQKTKKTETEKLLLQNKRIVWGCDICQQSCPMNRNKGKTDDSYFTEGYISDLSFDLIHSMTDEEFSKYPFSWRNKKVILDNISNINKQD
ncbi:MAG: epoxyqueuosine reductase [Clostridiales bacterium]|jgi:epoxyqueuosine reductase QueG|nr:epoxyqueuosine reductase [Clostridiales bacterium]